MRVVLVAHGFPCGSVRMRVCVCVWRLRLVFLLLAGV